MPEPSRSLTVTRELAESLTAKPTSVVALPRETIAALMAGTHADPFAILGPHQTVEGRIIRVFLPRATRVDVIARAEGTLLGNLLHHEGGCFVGQVVDSRPYLLRIFWPNAVIVTEDPYSFGLLLGEMDLHLLAEGRHLGLASCLGAHCMNIEGVAGVRFAVWAPTAKRVALIGDFNSWDARSHPMRYRHEAGVWELFVPRLRPGARYKYAIIAADGASLPPAADPIALRAELPPETASVITPPISHPWHDQDWMRTRAMRQGPDAPISIYEVDVSSWLRPHGAEPTWDTAIDRLLPYVTTLQFTHILLLFAPRSISHCRAEQSALMFAPPAKYGDLNGFVQFVDACHVASIGVIVDWHPEPCLIGAQDIDRRINTNCQAPPEQDVLYPDSLLNNIGRRVVQGYLIGSALRWLDDFHVDGLRVNALAALLRAAPARHADAASLSTDLIRTINAAILDRCPGAVTIAAEPAPWPGVTASIEAGGLGFSYQWNSGFAARTLRYISRDPIHRRWHHDEITFNLRSAFMEKYLHGLSRGDTSQGGGLRTRLPGDDWQQRACYRALMAFVWSHPGKKLIFMGCELAQTGDFTADNPIDWQTLDDRSGDAFIALTLMLNRLYRSEPALYQLDAHPNGFEWLVVNDQENSVFAYLRRGNETSAPIAVIANMTPVPRHNYRIGVPHSIFWREILNTDSILHGGSNLGNFGGVYAISQPSHGQPCSVDLTLPPLATILLRSTKERGTCEA